MNNKVYSQLELYSCCHYGKLSWPPTGVVQKLFDGLKFALSKYYCIINSETLKLFNDENFIQMNINSGKLQLNDNILYVHIKISMQKSDNIHDSCWSRNIDLYEIENI